MGFRPEFRFRVWCDVTVWHKRTHTSAWSTVRDEDSGVRQVSVWNNISVFLRLCEWHWCEAACPLHINTHAYNNRKTRTLTQVPNGSMSGAAVLLWHTTYTAHHITSHTQHLVYTETCGPQQHAALVSADADTLFQIFYNIRLLLPDTHSHMSTYRIVLLWEDVQ